MLYMNAYFFVVFSFYMYIKFRSADFLLSLKETKKNQTILYHIKSACFDLLFCALLRLKLFEFIVYLLLFILLY